MGRPGWSVVLALVALLGLPGAANARLLRGFVDDAAFRDNDDAGRALWLGKAASSGGDVVRIDVLWRRVAVRRPANRAEAASPGYPGYELASIDGAIRAATAAKVRVLLTIYSAPDWAEGPGRPSDARPGTWRPDPTALADFMTALARRYSGAFIPPGATIGLPAVRSWQVWNEPNLWLYLTPQWTKAGSGSSEASPAWYRRMLNASYTAMKAVSTRETVVAGGTAPYGDLGRGGRRIAPVRFMRRLLCLSDRLRPARCADPAHFDAIDHHPYGIASPDRPAVNADDVAVPDLGKLTRPLRRAISQHTVARRTGHALWVTEFSWDSSPPDPEGVPLSRHAQWLAMAVEQFWRAGARVALWQLVRDAPPIPSFGASYQSGVFFADGTPKPAATALSFPFTVRRRGASLRFWGIAPGTRRVVVERRSAGRWVRGPAVRMSGGRAFQSRSRRRPGTYRARTGRATSLTWTVR